MDEVVYVIPCNGEAFVKFSELKALANRVKGTGITIHFEKFDDDYSEIMVCRKIT